MYLKPNNFLAVLTMFCGIFLFYSAYLGCSTSSLEKKCTTNSIATVCKYCYHKRSLFFKDSSTNCFDEKKKARTQELYSRVPMVGGIMLFGILLFSIGIQQLLYIKNSKTKNN